jgi:pimeloyl-ACP methyl ester carboxylesterase
MTMSTSDADRRLLRLADGRRLAWYEFGSPGGLALVYCHGFPSSGREAALLHQAAVAAEVRVIAPDRPGFGGSDQLTGRRLIDWPDDLELLLDQLGIDRFGLIGVSGGGPYALACAWRLGERVRATTLVCPLGPVYLPEVLAAMRLPVRASISVGGRVPWLAELIYGTPTAAVLLCWPRIVERFRTLTAPASDRAVLADGDNAAILNATIEDAMQNGGLGPRAELRLYTRHWGLPLAEIRRPVAIWHGEADGTVPLAHGEWYAAHLPRTELQVRPGEGHYSLPIRYSSPILVALRRAMDA